MRAECPKCGRMAESLVVDHTSDLPVICDRCALERHLPPGYSLKPDTRPMARIGNGLFVATRRNA